MRARDPGEPRRPPDLRLVPAALAVWTVMLLGIGLGPVAALGAGAAATVILAVVAMPALRPRRGAPAVLAAAGCAAAAAVVATAHALLLVQHPLREPAERGAAATLRVVLRDDPRPIRTEAYGSSPGTAGQVLVPSVLAGVQVDAGHWSAGGRVLLIAPAEGWAGLLPGQSATAEGLLAPAGRRDLTIAVLRVRGPPQEVTAAPWWQHAAGGLRSGLREAAAAVLPPAPAGLLPGLAVGDTAGLTSEVEADFRAAGLTHLLAVSGANLAIVGGAVLALLRLLRADPRLAAALSAAAIAGFVVLARPSPSVVRAAAMGAVVLLALALGRGRSALPALAMAVLVLLLVDPALAVDPGFALSVLATAALVLLAPGWTDALRRQGVPTWAAEALAVPAAAFLVTAPLVAGLSGEVSPIAVVANLLAVPAVAPATVLGVLAAVLSPLGSAPAQACAWLAGPAVGWLVQVADRSAAVPGAVLSWPDGLTGAVLLGGLVLGLLVLGRSRRWRAMLLAVLVGLGLVLVPTRLVPPGWPPAGWAMVACDVGQGDAVVLATGRPGWVVLVDAGPGDGPVDACLDRLGVQGIAMVVLSHLHADHVGGLAGAVRGRPVGAVAVGPLHEPHWALRAVARRAAEAGAPLVALRARQRLRWPGLTVDVLAPRHPASGVDPDDGTAVNDGSLVLRATMPAVTALLTGDVELAAQADLLASGADLHAKVLKLPHHGSRYTSGSFLTAVAPRAVLVSVGAGNRYRHPDPGLLGGLEQRGVAVRRTDIHGDIAVVADVAAAEGERAAGGDSESAPLQVVTRGSPLPAPRRGPSWRPPLRPVARPQRCPTGASADAGRRGRCCVRRTCRRRRRDGGPGQRGPPVLRPHSGAPARAQARPAGSETALGEGLAHSLAGGRHRGRRAHLAGHRVEGLETVAGDQEHGLGVGVERARLHQLLRGGHGDPTGGLGEDTLGACEQPDGVHHLGVADVRDRATGAAHRVEDVGAVGGVADRE
jgi:competence protein ComEC